MPSVLTSWKEISNHLGKGVRTVQRWEIALGLPVHRSETGSGRAIFAVPEELDAWARSHPLAPSTAIVDSFRREITALREEVSDLRERLVSVESASPVFRFSPFDAASCKWALLLLNDLQQARLALRRTIEQSQTLREASQAVRGKSRALRVMLRPPRSREWEKLDQADGRASLPN
jgi:hypothetical protein